MPRALSVWFSPHPSRWQQEREINLDCSIAYLIKSFSAFLSSLAFAYIKVENDAKETRRKIKWVPRPQVRNRAGSGAISHQYLKHSKMNLFIKNKQKKKKKKTGQKPAQNLTNGQISYGAAVAKGNTICLWNALVCWVPSSGITLYSILGINIKSQYSWVFIIQCLFSSRLVQRQHPGLTKSRNMDLWMFNEIILLIFRMIHQHFNNHFSVSLKRIMTICFDYEQLWWKLLRPVISRLF